MSSSYITSCCVFWNVIYVVSIRDEVRLRHKTKQQLGYDHTGLEWLHSVFTSVICWLVGLSTGLHKNYWKDFRKTCYKTGFRPGTDPVNFWWRSGYCFIWHRIRLGWIKGVSWQRYALWLHLYEKDIWMQLFSSTDYSDVTEPRGAKLWGIIIRTIRGEIAGSIFSACDEDAYLFILVQRRHSLLDFEFCSHDPWLTASSIFCLGVCVFIFPPLTHFFFSTVPSPFSVSSFCVLCVSPSACSLQLPPPTL